MVYIVVVLVQITQPMKITKVVSFIG